VPVSSAGRGNAAATTGVYCFTPGLQGGRSGSQIRRRAAAALTAARVSPARWAGRSRRSGAAVAITTALVMRSCFATCAIPVVHCAQVKDRRDRSSHLLLIRSVFFRSQSTNI